MNNQNSQVSISREEIESVMSLYSSGKIEEAIQNIKSLNEEYPNVPILFNMLGACYKSIGENEGALKMFETATKIKLDYSEAHFNAGVIKQEFRRFEAAIESYKTVVSIKPEYYDAHNNLGIIYLETKDFDNAITHFNFAINYKKDFAEAHNNLGSVFQEQGQIEKALKSYEKATTLNSNYAQAHNNLGILLQMIGKNDKASLLINITMFTGVVLTGLFILIGHTGGEIRHPEIEQDEHSTIDEIAPRLNIQDNDGD